MDSPNKLSFVGLEVTAREVAWVDVPEDEAVQLSNACLFKAPKRKGARVVLEVFTEDGEMSKPCAVLAAVRAETQRLNVSVTKKIGFKLGGDDSKDAIVHITGYGYTLIDGDADFRPDDDEMEVSDDEDVEASDDSDDSENGDYEMGDDLKPENNGALKRIMKKVDAKEEKTEGKASEPKREPKADAQFKTHKTGLKLQDLLIGSGKAVKSGRNVGVEYVLRLESGKVVDKTRKKQPFKFRLGIGECIKGFDIGIAGMREGGSRHLIVPSSLGYGKQGAPPEIPPNSTLFFDIKVVKAW